MSAKVNAGPSLQQARLTDSASAKYASALPSSQRNTLARWRPTQTPLVRSEDMIIVLKPRTTLDIRKVFRHGDTGTRPHHWSLCRGLECVAHLGTKCVGVHYPNRACRRSTHQGL
ncbi:hypothetical protein MTO96_003855 [Rhipicephalus appendiculatus]